MFTEHKFPPFLVVTQDTDPNSPSRTDGQGASERDVNRKNLLEVELIS